MKIAIDIDKTLFECKSALYEFASKIEGAMTIKPPSTPVFLDKSSIIKKNIKARNLFGRIGNPEYYSEIDGSVEFINKLASDGRQITFLSSRPNMRTMNNVVLTWLEKNKVEYDFLVVGCSNKAKFCQKYGIGILIDDNIHNCLNASKVGVETILLDTKGKFEQSDVVKKYGIHHARNWNAVYKIANKLIEKESQRNQPETDEVQMG